MINVSYRIMGIGKQRPRFSQLLKLKPRLYPGAQLKNLCSQSLTFPHWSESHSVVWPHWLYSPWNSPGQNTGVGSLSLLQGIIPTQGSNPGLPCCRRILYQLSHRGSPGILEWVAYSFSSRSSRLRNQTRVSCTAGGFFTNRAIREASVKQEANKKNPYIIVH